MVVADRVVLSCFDRPPRQEVRKCQAKHNLGLAYGRHAMAARGARRWDDAPAHLGGTAFGFYSLITGATLLVASVVAGWLWTAFGSAAAFMAGALFAGLALIGIFLRASPAPPSHDLKLA